MQIEIVSVVGRFDTAPDPRRPTDKQHRIIVNDVEITAQYRRSSDAAWIVFVVELAAGMSYDGSSRPELVGFLIPRFGIFSLAAGAHDKLFEGRDELPDGTRIDRKMTDLLFLRLMEWLAVQRIGWNPPAGWLAKVKWFVTGGWKYPAQLLMARVMYRAVRQFGGMVWNKHDPEFRVGTTS